MQRYIVLLNFTEAGIQNVAHWQEMLARAVACLKVSRGRLEVYLTMGPYDAVALALAPDDETMAAALLHLAGYGQVRTTCLKAFDQKQHANILKIMQRFPKK